ncbi:lamin tail domain-containing protein [Pyxidicoccus parkwayensis]|uniref:Lamin tail domain-containing protein n=1 Tax=Pyxidicoccus parkwayensis TaxID=2813578 RepID=A0ABX7NY54_9BACT|nr:lamin tail domain-containing protein [Pyxidicoccus parkwaysis]QSQ23789.1 lamin tail domain-containing protein [Pyxidicoccus parkwaysis]
MSRPSFPLARLLGLSVLCLGVALGCGDETEPQPTPTPKPLPDAALSRVEVSRASQVVADGEDAVTISVTVKQKDGTPMEGRTVRVEVSGDGNTVTQPAAKTNAEGRTTASVVSSKSGSKTVTASVDADGGAVVLGTRPVIEFIAHRPTRLAFTATALSATAGTPIGDLEVTLKDGKGRTVAGATDEVTLSLVAGPGDATLEGTLKAHAVDGVVRFSEAVLKKAGTGYQLKVEATGLEGATSPAFAVAPAAASALEVSGLPAVSTAGAAQSAQVTVRDAFGNVATGYAGTLAVTSSDATAALPAAHTFTAQDAGRFTFAGITLKRAGNQHVDFQDGAVAALKSSHAVGVVAGGAAALVFTQVPARTSVHATLSTVKVAVQDAFGNAAAVGEPVVTMGLAGNGVGLGGVLQAAPVDGVANFASLRLEEEGSFKLLASATGLGSATSAAIDVVDDVPPAKPTLAAGASTPTSVTVTWTAVGDDGNVGQATSQELRYSVSPITTDAEFNAATPVGGVGAPAAAGNPESATVTGLTARQTYHVALRVTDNRGNSARSNSLMVQTRDPDVAQLAFTTQPANGTAGQALAQVVVALQDSNGNVVSSSTAPVTLSLVGNPNVELATVSAVNGVATFNGLRVDKAGTHHLSASATSLTKESNAFTVSPGSANRIALTGLVAPVTAGVANSLDVTLYDSFDNVATGYAGTVHFSSTDAQAQLPANYIFVPGTDAGHHVFNGVVLVSAGPRRVTVADVGNAQLTASLDVEVGSDAADHLLLTGLAADVTAGASHSLVLSARDRFGNIVTGYSGTVHFTSNDAQAVLPADYVFAPGDNGQHTFSVTLRTVGARSVTATELGGAGHSVTANTNVASAAADRLELSITAAPVVSGQAVDATVTLLDAYGNRASAYRGTVGFEAQGDAQATVPTNYTFTEADSGRHTFSVTFASVGDKLLVAQDIASSGLRDSEPVTVGPGALAELRVDPGTEPYIAGQTHFFVVTAYDGAGNRKTDYTGMVRITTSDPNPGLLEYHTFREEDQGEFILRATLQTSGQQTLTFQDTVIAVSKQLDVTVEAAEPVKLVILEAPATGSVRQPLAQLRAALRDSFDNTALVTTPAVTVRLVGGPAGTTLGGTTTVNPVDGVATFSNLTVDQEGAFNLRVESANQTLTEAQAELVITDDQAPAPATGFTAELGEDGVASLSWRATGDDGTDGLADHYELRYSAATITPANFASATLVTTGTPQSAGTLEGTTVNLPVEEGTWYFGLRVVDGAGNASTLVTTSVFVPGPCSGVVCPQRAPECAADNVSRVTYTSACEVQNGEAHCVDTPTQTACTGANAVCFEAACDTAPPPAAGELAISEVMHTPSVGTTEYLELTSTVDGLRNVTNVQVSFDNGAGGVESFTVQAPGNRPTIVRGHGTFVAASNTDAATNGGVPAQHGFGGGAFALGSSGRLTVKLGATTVDDLLYTASFPQTTGRSMNLSSVVLGTAAHQYSWYWCDSSAVLPGGDRGTPGQPNESCAVAINPPVDYCAIQFPKTIAAPIQANTPQTIYSRFYDDQISNRNQNGNDNFPFIVAELGYGTDANAPQNWTWVPAPFNASYTATTERNNDETVGTLNIGTTGSYLYGFRYHFTRGPTGADTWVYCDQNGVVSGTPQYGTVTVAPPPAPLTNHVVISEICGGNGTGTASTDEFIELYNPTNSDVDISGWLVQYKSATGAAYSGSVAIPPGKVIKARGYFLLGGATFQAGTTTADVSYSFDLSSSTTAGGHVRIGPGLSNNPSDVAVDKVAWGTGNSPEGTAAPSHPAVGGSLERKAVSTSISTTMAVGGADASRGNGYDSNDNSKDIVTRAIRQPQNSASPTEFYSP